ncbi:MAG: helix-turn-helix domain-containing protein [Oscillospiraceae bacterium]|nr:helix-turn-helix domain-containing protein [Oscillospiraceae bacterium]
MLGQRLKGLREDNDMTQEDLAEKLNVSLHTVAKYERNEREPNDSMKVEIAKIFDVSLDYLVGLCDQKCSYNRVNSIFVPYTLDDEGVRKIQEYIDMVVGLRESRGRKVKVGL